MTLSITRSVHTTDMANIGKLLPELFAVFEAQQLSAIYINPVGLNLLDPTHKSSLEKLSLTQIIGVNEQDRFNREIYPQTRVMGSWAGKMVLRDTTGSEVACRVKVLEVPDPDRAGVRLLYFYASQSKEEAASEGYVPDSDLLYALLETTLDCVYFKDIASRFLRISRAHAKLFGLTSPRDAIGKTDFDFFTSEHASPAFQDEQRIMKTEIPLINSEEKETHGDGRITWASTTKLPFRDRAGKLIGTFGISRDITEQKKTEQRIKMLSLAIEQCPVSIVITDVQSDIEYVNPYFEKNTGYTLPEVVGENPRILQSGLHSKEFYQGMWKEISVGNIWMGELSNRKKNGEHHWERAAISALRGENGQITHYVAVKEDITHLKEAEKQRHEMDTRLQLTSKMESVGTLAAGVAHEVNTPTQFISDNIRFLQSAFAQIGIVLKSHRDLVVQAATSPDCAPALAAITAAETENELGYLVDEIPRCLEQSLDGLKRIGKIVGSLKEFSHPGGEDKSHADLNRAIETTVAVSRHEWKYVADVVTELDPGLPPVLCVIDEINQAVLNLVVNAAHAVEDANKQRGEARGRITIRTRLEKDQVVIEVQDTGTGIPEKVRSRVFEPFFTTKGVGKGTGQGLAIVHTVVVKKHRGSIDFITELGKGTTFKLMLPIAPAAADATHSAHQPEAEIPK